MLLLLATILPHPASMLLTLLRNLHACTWHCAVTAGTTWLLRLGIISDAAHF